MLIDFQELFSDAQAITADAISTYVINLLPTGGGAIGAGAAGGPSANTVARIGDGKPLYLYVRVDTTFDSVADTSSLITSLESDDNTSLSSATVHWTSADIEEATLVAGYWIAKGVPIPPGDYQKYLGLRFNVGAEENFTAGAVSAWLSDIPPHDERQYETGRLTGVG